MVINENCYVMFLDILGFKDIIIKRDSNDVKAIFDTIVRTREKILEDNKYCFEQLDFAIQNAYIRIMSDSIVMAIPTKIPVSLAFLGECCRTLQASLLREGIVLRGGIAEGEFYGDEEIMYGKGLVKAYNLECISEYPRVIISPDVVHSYVNRVGTSTPIYITDFIMMSKEDEFYFVNYLMVYLASYEQKELVDFIVMNIENGLQSPNVRKKYLWLKKYYNRCIIEEHYAEYYGLEEKSIDIDITKDM